MKEGFVYILINPSFKKNYIKIGVTPGTVEQRMKELQTTGVPEPFEVYATLKTDRIYEVERFIHLALPLKDVRRVAQNREFFEYDPAKALDFMILIRDLLGKGEITTYGIAATRAKEKAERRTNLAGMEEWLSVTSFKDVDSSEIKGFIDGMMNLGYNIKTGASDLHIKLPIIKGKQIGICLLLWHDGKTASFQPSNLYRFANEIEESTEVIDKFLESIKAFLSARQRNKTPYEPLNGYYYIDFKTLVDHKDEILGIFSDLLNSMRK